MELGRALSDEEWEGIFQRARTTARSPGGDGKLELNYCIIGITHLHAFTDGNQRQVTNVGEDVGGGGRNGAFTMALP